MKSLPVTLLITMALLVAAPPAHARSRKLSFPYGIKLGMPIKQARKQLKRHRLKVSGAARGAKGSVSFSPRKLFGVRVHGAKLYFVAGRIVRLRAWERTSLTEEPAGILMDKRAKQIAKKLGKKPRKNIGPGGYWIWTIGKLELSLELSERDSASGDPEDPMLYWIELRLRAAKKKKK